MSIEQITIRHILEGLHTDEENGSIRLTYGDMTIECYPGGATVKNGLVECHVYKGAATIFDYDKIVEKEENGLGKFTKYSYRMK